METKLKDITTYYSKFTPNQVLTESQLNAFIDYFDDQDRLTRINLIGVGIACGFTLTPNYNSSESIASLTIMQGTAVTTDGDLVQFFDLVTEKLASKQFSFYKKFEDTKANYTHFLDAQDEVFDMWELGVENDGTYTNLTSFSNLQNMAVVLYLEQYAKQDDLCNQFSCNNQGSAQMNNLKVLLIHTDDLESIIANEDTIYSKNNWSSVFENLNHIAVPRDIIRFSETNTDSDYKQLKAIYERLIFDTSLITDLKSDLATILNFAGKTSAANQVSISLTNLFTLSNRITVEDFQYRYDLLKDVVTTYNEIKEFLTAINFSCCPDINAFPKHIMLGKLNETASELTLRHEFYPSSIGSEAKNNWQKLMSLLDRIVRLTLGYQGKGMNDVKITPSLTIAKLGKKAVPAYYNVSNHLLKTWDFDKTKKGKQNTNLSYHTDKLSNHPAIQEPLKYTLDTFNFFRIEGIHGKSYTSALAEVLRLRDTLGLNFDVKILQLNPSNSTIALEDYKSIFNDLQTSLALWQAELSCSLAAATTLLSGFSLGDAGKNTASGTYVGIGYVEEDPFKLDEPFAVASKMKGNSNVFEEYEQANTYKNSPYRRDFNNLGSFTKKEDAFRKRILIHGNLSKEPDSIGELFAEILKDANITIADYETLRSIARQRAQQNYSDLGNLEPDFFEIVVGLPIDILSVMYYLTSVAPTALTELQDTDFTEFNKALDNLCELNDAYKLAYDRSDLDPNSDDIDKDLKRDINILVTRLAQTCCFGEKLEVIQNELTARTALILEELQLKSYVKKHPGLRHMAGVPDGGTFVMAYLGDTETVATELKNTAIEFQFYELPTSRTAGRITLWDTFQITFLFQKQESGDQNIANSIDDGQGPNLYLSNIYFGENDTIESISNSFINVLNFKFNQFEISDKIKAFKTHTNNTIRIEIKDQEVEEQSYGISYGGYLIDVINGASLNQKIYFPANNENDTQITGANTVVADFALPYRCCGDGLHVNFIVPKEQVILSLPTKFVCIEDGVTTNPLDFTADPSGGIVAAVVAEDFQSLNMVDIVDGITKFFPDRVPESLHGTTIQFTLNGKATDCQIVVEEKKEIIIQEKQLGGAPYWSNGKLVFDKEFEVIFSDANASDFTLEWKVNGVTETTTGTTLTKSFEITESTSFTISVAAVSQLGCSTEDVFAVDIIFPNFTITVSNEICLNSVQEISVEPNYQGTVLLGNGVSQNDNGQWQIQPSGNVGDQVTISLQGTNISKTIGITGVPDVRFTYTYDKEKRILYLTNETKDVTSLQWIVKFDEKNTKKYEGESVEVNVKEFNTDRSLVITLKAKNSCGASFKEKVINLNQIESCIGKTAKAIFKLDGKLDKILEHIDFNFTDDFNVIEYLEEIKETVITPVESNYEKVITSIGSENEILPDSFLLNYNNDLIVSIANHVSKIAKLLSKAHQNKESDKEYVLKLYYYIEVILLFQMVRCQQENLNEENLAVFRKFVSELRSFKKEGMHLDLKEDASDGDGVGNYFKNYYEKTTFTNSDFENIVKDIVALFNE